MGLNFRITTKEEYESLCDEIWRHNRLYFQEASPEISDEEFDEQVRLLERVESEHPEWISETSPSRRIGEESLRGFPEIEHTEPMLSLEKAYERDEVEAFYERVCRLTEAKSAEFYGELKMDGLAISITYEHGKLIRAVTRGDGRFGSDITPNCKTIRGLPLRIPHDIELLEVRGEVFIPKKSFLEMNERRVKEGLPLWANPRNAAAGTLKLLDSREVAKREGLSCVLYGIAQQLPRKVHYQHEVFSYLHSLGLPTYLSMKDLPIVPLRKVNSVDEMLLFANEIHAIREELPFGIDGVVFKLDSLDISASIAPTLKHPRTAIAWKFGAERVWTRLKSIEIGVGRTGVITPVAELEPVELMGSTISRATLHNAEEIQRKDIRPFDRVLIEKGGDVIPKVVMSDTSMEDRSPPWKMPENCPSCGTKLVQDEDGVAFRCPNHEHCPEQVIRGLIHFVSKDGLDIENIGEKLIRIFYEKGFVRRPSDLFHLTLEQLLQLEGIQEKSANNILRGLSASKNPDLASLLMALGLRHVGKGMAQRLSERAKTLEDLLAMNRDDLLSVDGIGEEVATAVYDMLQNPSFRSQLVDLAAADVFPKRIVINEDLIGNPFYQKSIVFTGTLSMPRTEAAKRVESLGGRVSETVSKKTDFLVIGDTTGSKAEKAKKLGVHILTEREFAEMLKTEQK